MGATITPLPISSYGDSYSGLLPDPMTSYDVNPVSSVNSSLAAGASSPSGSSSWTNISNLINSLGSATVGILRSTGVVSPSPGTTNSGTSVASAAGSSTSLDLIFILVALGIGFVLLHGVK